MLFNRFRSQIFSLFRLKSFFLLINMIENVLFRWEKEFIFRKERFLLNFIRVGVVRVLIMQNFIRKLQGLNWIFCMNFLLPIQTVARFTGDCDKTFPSLPMKITLLKITLKPVVQACTSLGHFSFVRTFSNLFCFFVERCISKWKW